jgi:hypothetical protein
VLADMSVRRRSLAEQPVDLAIEGVERIRGD